MSPLVKTIVVTVLTIVGFNILCNSVSAIGSAVQSLPGNSSVGK